MSGQFLGFDLSTQQLKGIVVGSDLKLLHEAKVDFDADLSKYGIEKGVLTNPDEGQVFSPVAMFLEAIDLVLQQLKDQGADLSKVQGISGAGMQHGTVFWSNDAESLLGNLDASKTLLEQLGGSPGGREKSAFSHPFSPNWQDASTQEQCEGFDAALGGSNRLALVTGSSAHHRFSGPQIQRFRQRHTEAYKATARISLVSSFLASIFLGRVAPIDISDVCGTNLWDIKNGSWHEHLLALAAGGRDGVADLKSKLGDIPEDGGASFGPISPYFSHRYGFPASTQIIPFTGDNPSTILALPLRASDAIVSLGTSTTFLMSTRQYKPDPAYHFMNHPTTPGLYMFMLCYKNGGLAREHIRNAINTAVNSPHPTSWDAFNEIALATPPLGQSSPADPMRLGLFFPRPEIVPNVKAGTWRFLWHNNKTLTPVEANSSSSLHDDNTNNNNNITNKTNPWSLPHHDARAILESQFLSLRLRSQSLVSPQPQALFPFSLPPQPRRIYLVGGAAINPAIAHLAALILGGSDGIYQLQIGSNACALGAAYKAAWGVLRGGGEGGGDCEEGDCGEGNDKNTKKNKCVPFEDFLEKRWEEEEFVRRIGGGYREGVWERYGEALGGLEEVERVVVGGGGGGGTR